MNVEDQLVELVPRTASRVLWVGCGRGRAVAKLKRRLPRAWVVGNDPDPEAMTVARARCDEFFGESVVAFLPYPPQWFSAVVLDRGVPPEDLGRALRVLSDVLDDDGVLVARFPSRMNFNVQAGFAVGAWVERERRVNWTEPAHFWTRSDVAGALADAGLAATTTELVPDPSLDGVVTREGSDLASEWFVLKGLAPEDLDEAMSSEILVTARRASTDSRPRVARAKTRRELAWDAAVVARHGGRSQVSVCLIVKNEEQRLDECLERLAPVADELIVVDTGSEDRTVEIARRHGAQVFFHEWANDYSAPRNAAIARATKDWILMMDADQLLDRAAPDEIRRLIASGECNVWRFRELNYMDEVGTATVVEKEITQLYRRDIGPRFVGEVHEHLVSERPVVSGRSRVTVHHEGNRSHADMSVQAERDVPIIEEALAKNPRSARDWYALGLSLAILRRDEDAVGALEKVVALCAGGDGFRGYWLSAELNLAEIAARNGDHAASARHAKRALAIDPGSADALLALGEAHLHSGRLGEARRSFAQALASRGRPAAPGPINLSASGWRAHLGLGQTYLAEERWHDALASLARARALHPRHPAILEGLGRAWKALGREAEGDAFLGLTGAGG